VSFEEAGNGTVKPDSCRQRLVDAVRRQRILLPDEGGERRGVRDQVPNPFVGGWRSLCFFVGRLAARHWNLLPERRRDWDALKHSLFFCRRMRRAMDSQEAKGVRQ
jgi:hypothetical protein